MRRSPMPDRQVPLVAKTGLRRTSPPASSLSRSAKHGNQPRRSSPSGIPAAVRRALAARSDGVCEIQAADCAGRAVDPSHRKTTGMGGRKGAAAVRHHVLSNLLHACRMCHEQAIHAMPAVAFWNGWMLREHEDPTAVPALYRGARARLGDDGSVSPIRAEEA